jgi:hypothetical protein
MNGKVKALNDSTNMACWNVEMASHCLHASHPITTYDSIKSTGVLVNVVNGIVCRQLSRHLVGLWVTGHPTAMGLLKRILVSYIPLL